jgi:hypothetical protein
MRNSPFIGGSTVYIFGSIGVAVVNVVCWSLSWHWLIRLAGALGFGILLGLVALPTIGQFAPPFFAAYYLLQAMVLSAWLASGYVIQPAAECPSAGSPPQTESARTG